MKETYSTTDTDSDQRGAKFNNMPHIFEAHTMLVASLEHVTAVICCQRC